MDQITKSLEDYLKTSLTEFNVSQKENKSKGVTSTSFDIADPDNYKSMSVLIEISPQTHTIFITGYPHITAVNKDLEQIKSFETEWNKSQKLINFSVSEESVAEIYKYYNIQLFSIILSDANGLTRLLWRKYLNMFFKETLQIWNYISA